MNRIRHRAIELLLLGLLLAVALLVAVPAHGSPASSPTLEAWLLEATLSWSPAYELKARPKDGVPAESVEEAKSRRAKIVSAVISVANDPSEAPLFKGPTGRVQTATFLVAVWSYESDFDLRVERYHCAGLPKGSCDSGAAWCFGQIHMKDAGKLLPAGWTGRDLEIDVGKCARATLRVLRAAAAQCPDLEGADRFSAYASGHCGASPAMRARLYRATSWAKGHPIP